MTGKFRKIPENLKKNRIFLSKNLVDSKTRRNFALANPQGDLTTLRKPLVRGQETR